MAEEATKEMVQDTTPKKAMFMNRPYSQEERVKKDEEELARLVKEQKSTGETSEEKIPSEEEPANAEEKTFKKRYGDLRRHMQEKEKEWNDKFEAFEKRMEKESIVPPKSDEDIEEWAKQYPDVAGIVETIAAKKAQEMFSKADARLQELDRAQSEAERVKAENAIRKAHDDFDDLRSSDEFHNWAEEQPKWVQDALYENADDPASVVRVIDLYKVDKGLTKTAKKAKAKDAASTVTRRSKTSVDVDESGDTIRESDVAKMSDKEFEAKSEEINKAIRSGKFVYDVSGKAR